MVYLSAHGGYDLAMRIAMVNPNRMRNPPVIPIGLEYVTHAIRAAGHEAAMLDLCFIDDVGPAIDRFLADFRPEAAFLSIRNVDSVIRAEDQFFLREHRTIAERITAAGVRLVVGGAGLPSMPEAIMRYLGADAAVVGPGEGAAVVAAEVVASLAVGRPPCGAGVLPASVGGREAGITKRERAPLLINGFDVPFDPAVVPQRGIDVDYAAYYARDGVAGFASSYGCPCRCPFCIEARTGVRCRNVDAVAAEVRGLVEKGWRRMHLCDAEMNVSLEHAVALCEALVGSGARWMTYMRCAPCDARLAGALRRSDCELATVTVNSATDEPRTAAGCIRLLKAEGVKVAVDLSCGLPDEAPEQARSMIAALHEARPERVGVTVRFRLYPTTPLAERIRADAAERRWTTGDPEFVLPAYYCRFDPAEVQRWIEGLDGFSIDTGEAVNYQRLSQERAGGP